MLSNIQMVAVKKAIESTYADKCTVIEYEEYEKSNGSTGFREVQVLENQPCKLSFSALNASGDTDTGSPLVQVPKLFISLDVRIKPGSKILIDRNGAIIEYKNSGQPGTFLAHQEIILELFDGWA